jgi:hypothetical protein
MKAKRLSRETTTEKTYLFNIEIRGGINGGKRKRGPPHRETPPLQGVLLLQTVPEDFNNSSLPLWIQCFQGSANRLDVMFPSEL